MTEASQRPQGSDPAVEHAVLDVRGLDAAYGQTQVLRGVSLGVQQGEAVSLVGRNGVGKTTTLRSVLGNVEVTAGTIELHGVDVTHTPANETVKRGIAIVPEDRRIFPDLTVRENLELGALGGADGRARRGIDEVLDMFGNLRDRADSLGSNLSGGEQQMLAIGRSLVSGADVLLLDEPTEGLAPLIIERVEALIRELNEEGLTLLLVEQNAEVALSVTERVYVMDRGQIVFHGTAEELRENTELRDRFLGVKV